MKHANFLETVSTTPNLRKFSRMLLQVRERTCHPSTKNGVPRMLVVLQISKWKDKIIDRREKRNGYREVGGENEEGFLARRTRMESAKENWPSYTSGRQICEGDLAFFSKRQIKHPTRRVESVLCHAFFPSVFTMWPKQHKEAKTRGKTVWPGE